MPQNPSIPSAVEALAITESEITKQSSKLLDKIVERIHAAAVELKTDAKLELTGVERNAAEHVQSILHSTGYEVKVEEMNDPREGSWTVIHFSWARAKTSKK